MLHAWFRRRHLDHNFRFPMIAGSNRGIALLSVLWVTGLLAVMAASFASSARTEARLAHNQEESAKAEALADAGVHRAVFGLLDLDRDTAWRAGDAAYVFSLGDGDVQVWIEDEDGKIDLIILYWDDQSRLFMNLEQLLGTADFLTLHMPLIPETTHFLNRERFAQMKPGVQIVNCARGELIEEAALYEELESGRVQGAALDVFEVEPLPKESPLRDPKLHLKLRKFHHFASGAKQTRLSPDPNIGMGGRTVQAVLDMLEGNYDGDPKKMPYIVNKEAF